MYKNNTIFAMFSNFQRIFVIFAHSFPKGVIIIPKMLELRSPINFNSTRISDSGKKGRKR